MNFLPLVRGKGEDGRSGSQEKREEEEGGEGKIRDGVKRLHDILHCKPMPQGSSV